MEIGVSSTVQYRIMEIFSNGTKKILGNFFVGKFPKMVPNGGILTAEIKS